MSQNAPAFASSEEDVVSRACTARRWITGILCALISLGVLFGVCYILELTKAKLTKEAGLSSTTQPVRQPKKKQRNKGEKASSANADGSVDKKR